MPDPPKGDHRMDPATATGRRGTGDFGSAFKKSSGVILAIVLAIVVVFGLIALFLLPAGG